MNSLLIVIGKRVQLIKDLNNFKVIGVDCLDLITISSFVDEFYELPKSYAEN